VIHGFLSKLCLAAIHLFPSTRFYGLKRALLTAAGMRLGRNVRVVSSARFITSFIEIGDNTFVSYEALLIAAHGSRIKIGANVDIGPRCTMTTGNHKIGGSEHRAGEGFVSNIVIEDGCWIAQNSTILGGVHLGEGTIVTSGTVVTRSAGPNVMCIGNPMRIMPIPYAEPSGQETGGN
jgi:acetyltransferase-like isoleucine patch superfamily enzyme